MQDNLKISRKNSFNIALGRSSNTAHNFTKGNVTNSTVTVALDWFACMITHTMIEKEVKEGELIENNGVYLQHMKSGAGQFKHLYYIYIENEHVGQLLVFPRNNAILKPTSGKLEIQNWVFYTNLFHTYLKRILESHTFHLNNISRIDIALDNVNHLHGFLNRFAKQKSVKKSKYIMVNRARFHAGVMDKTFTFNHFKVGSGRKVLSVYEKNQEINTNSLHKSYIIDFWRANGIAAEYKDKVWRAEIRLGSEALREIKDLDISLQNLDDPHFLYALYLTSIDGWFEFREKIGQEKNVSRMKAVNLFEPTLKVERLEKIPRARIDGHYKAKMAIHQLTKDIITNKIDDANEFEAALKTIERFSFEFNLYEYYNRKVPDWIKEYSAITPNALKSGDLQRILLTA